MRYINKKFAEVLNLLMSWFYNTYMNPIPERDELSRNKSESSRDDKEAT